MFFLLQKRPQGRKRVQLVSDDEDDVPLKARPVAKAGGGDESSDDNDGAMPQCVEDSDDATALKVKVVNEPCLCDSRNNRQPKVEWCNMVTAQ